MFTKTYRSLISGKNWIVDRYAVAVMKDAMLVGHLPRKISLICSLFLRRGGNIKCCVTANRCYSDDLPQGGLQVPCLLVFDGKEAEISKIKTLTGKIKKKRTGKE